MGNKFGQYLYKFFVLAIGTVALLNEEILLYINYQPILWLRIYSVNILWAGAVFLGVFCETIPIFSILAFAYFSSYSIFFTLYISIFICVIIFSRYNLMTFLSLLIFFIAIPFFFISMPIKKPQVSNDLSWYFIFTIVFVNLSRMLNKKINITAKSKVSIFRKLALSIVCLLFINNTPYMIQNNQVEDILLNFLKYDETRYIGILVILCMLFFSLLKRLIIKVSGYGDLSNINNSILKDDKLMANLLENVKKARKYFEETKTTGTNDVIDESIAHFSSFERFLSEIQHKKYISDIERNQLIDFFQEQEHIQFLLRQNNMYEQISFMQDLMNFTNNNMQDLMNFTNNNMQDLMNFTNNNMQDLMNFTRDNLPNSNGFADGSTSNFNGFANNGMPGMGGFMHDNMNNFNNHNNLNGF